MNDKDFRALCASVRQAGKILRGEQKPARVYRFDDVAPAVIRRRLRLSQNKFALLLGVSTRTLQGWEQGARKPRGPARSLLRVAEKEPRALLRALLESPRLASKTGG